ncbi:hypothetical protein B1987_28350 [Mycobacterium kansasii]|uniref:SalK n=1 Tax=Mycobacterium attenuatum TaxID=2341086 RepID=A0A498Q1V0_9MYCO|nr:hypothetical protein [Mycobacterium attenuatum]ORB87036.1 hypothetical protein B1987_28350 [Mycobacterium kansasii]VBA38884.1 hypothetical protein LAUMK136_02688 [Mycobacterium attenuatum]VBA53085.1 hypothetical protein LAUMK191_02653 [Mycobacterium attenuatum]VBA57972.1 hypothetical protein LAUMK41_02730 [Mycobacterium attenuatum]
MHRAPELARHLYDRFEPVHAVTYFAPEARAALTNLGYRGFWMGYFAARSAPLGQVPPEVVTALFYNFAHARVSKALPTAWEIAGPPLALRARATSAVAALRRYGLRDDDENVRTAARLVGDAARRAPVDGRALFAANLALPWPQDPVAALWHATTLLREQRGDGHVAVLVAAGISGREANVLHCAASSVPRDYLMQTRHYDDAEWRACEQSLIGRGLLGEDGSLTSAGRDLKQRLEASTDALALRAYDGLDDSELQALLDALTPIARTVIDGGDMPAVTPMSLRRDF